MKYFDKWELDCKCGCGLYNITPELEQLLDQVRELAGVPLIISSGSRCEKHNKAEGGSPNSSHLRGLAVDVKVRDSQSRYRVLKALEELNIERIGIAKSFIHFDIDRAKPTKVVWVY